MAVLPGDIIRCTASMDANGILVQSVWHVICLGISTSSDSDIHAEIAARIDSCYATIVHLQKTTFDFNSITTWNVTQDRPMLVGGWPSVGSGTSSGEQMPPETCMYMKFATGTARSQGRKKLGPFVTTARGPQGLPEASAYAALAAFGVAALTPWIYASGILAFGNWRDDTKPDGPLFSVWSGAIVGSYFRSQRSRYPDAGP